MFAKIKNIVIIAGLFVASWSSFSFAQDLPTAKEFADKCGRDGGVKYLDEITREWNNPIWVNLLEKVASGDEEWIRASSCMGRSFDYTNQTVIVSLNIVWAQALPKHPKAVLALSGMDISLGRICSFPIIEPERAWAAQYVKDTLAALEAIPDDAKMWNIPLNIEKQVCALYLKDAYERKYDYAD